MGFKMCQASFNEYKIEELLKKSRNITQAAASGAEFYDPEFGFKKGVFNKEFGSKYVKNKLERQPSKSILKRETRGIDPVKSDLSDLDSEDSIHNLKQTFNDNEKTIDDGRKSVCSIKSVSFNHKEQKHKYPKNEITEQQKGKN